MAFARTLVVPMGAVCCVVAAKRGEAVKWGRMHECVKRPVKAYCNATTIFHCDSALSVKTASTNSAKPKLLDVLQWRAVGVPIHQAPHGGKVRNACGPRCSLCC